MTDDLSKYEKLAWRLPPDVEGNGEIVDAITDLIEMVREAREGRHKSSEHEPTWAELTDFWKNRAEAAETENAKLRKALETIVENEDQFKMAWAAAIARAALGKE